MENAIITFFVVLISTGNKNIINKYATFLKLIFSKIVTCICMYINLKVFRGFEELRGPKHGMGRAAAQTAAPVDRAGRGLHPLHLGRGGHRSAPRSHRHLGLGKKFHDHR